MSKDLRQAQRTSRKTERTNMQKKRQPEHTQPRRGTKNRCLFSTAVEVRHGRKNERERERVILDKDLTPIATRAVDSIQKIRRQDDRVPFGTYWDYVDVRCEYVLVLNTTHRLRSALRRPPRLWFVVHINFKQRNIIRIQESSSNFEFPI